VWGNVPIRLQARTPLRVDARRPPAAHAAAHSYMGMSGERLPSPGEGTPVRGGPHPPRRRSGRPHGGERHVGLVWRGLPRMWAPLDLPSRSPSGSRRPRSSRPRRGRSQPVTAPRGGSADPARLQAWPPAWLLPAVLCAFGAALRLWQYARLPVGRRGEPCPEHRRASAGASAGSPRLPPGRAAGVAPSGEGGCHALRRGGACPAPDPAPREPRGAAARLARRAAASHAGPRRAARPRVPRDGDPLRLLPGGSAPLPARAR
jgi:hypothetical protein